MSAPFAPELLQAACQGDRDACQRMLEENAGLIWSIVRRYQGRGADSEDLYQLACMGFLKAIQGFDPAFGTQFSTYAVPKIAGEIRRFLRDDGAMKVSRGLKERGMSIRAAQQQLTGELGQSPTLSQLSQATGLSPEEIAQAELALDPVTSLQAETGEDGLTLEGTLGTQGLEEDLLEKLSLHDALSQLPRRERQVVLLRYFRGMTQSACAGVLGVSQVQVSRLERRALDKLRQLLAPP